MNHNRIARPQVEATVLVEGITKKIVKCTARKSFTVGNSHIAEGETFFLVASERRAQRYYVVHFDSSQTRPQCSCGANHKAHAHIEAYNAHVVESVVKSVPDGSRPLTKEEWKKIAKLDKARQQAWQDEYRQAAAALSQAG
jgi:hypothetical protein